MFSRSVLCLSLLSLLTLNTENLDKPWSIWHRPAGTSSSARSPSRQRHTSIRPASGGLPHAYTSDLISPSTTILRERTRPLCSVFLIPGCPYPYTHADVRRRLRRLSTACSIASPSVHSCRRQCSEYVGVYTGRSEGTSRPNLRRYLLTVPLGTGRATPFSYPGANRRPPTSREDECDTARELTALRHLTVRLMHLCSQADHPWSSDVMSSLLCSLLYVVSSSFISLYLYGPHLLAWEST